MLAFSSAPLSAICIHTECIAPTNSTVNYASVVLTIWPVLRSESQNMLRKLYASVNTPILSAIFPCFVSDHNYPCVKFEMMALHITIYLCFHASVTLTVTEEVPRHYVSLEKAWKWPKPSLVIKMVIFIEPVDPSISNLTHFCLIVFYAAYPAHWCPLAEQSGS